MMKSYVGNTAHDPVLKALFANTVEGEILVVTQKQFDDSGLPATGTYSANNCSITIMIVPSIASIHKYMKLRGYTSYKVII